MSQKLKPTIAFISPYPNRGEIYSANASGIASYTKNIVRHLPYPTLVVADYKTKPETYTEDASIVRRSFQINSWSMWLKMLRSIRKHPSVHTVFIQFDFALYGGVVKSALIIPFIFILRLHGMNVKITTHSVVTDVNKLKGHLGLTESPVDKAKAQVMNFTFRLFYILISMICMSVIVLEQKLKKEYEHITSASNIEVIAHGVDTELPLISKDEARKKLGLAKDDYIVLFFGYVNWFKGADFFANTFSKVPFIEGKKVHALIAGGESVTMKTKNYYKKYFESVAKTVCDSPVLSMSGFVPQSEITTYFCASDIVIFPYRTCMAASGALSLLFTYEKPFLLSDPMSQVLESLDILESLKYAELKTSDIVFKMNSRACISKVAKVLRNGLKAKMVKMTQDIKNKRDYKTSAIKYADLAVKHIEKNRNLKWRLSKV